MESAVIVLVAAVLIIALGLYFIFGKRRRQNAGKQMVEAVIVDHVTKTTRTNGDHATQTSTTSSFPVYEYEVDGKTYRVQGSVGITVFSKDRCRIGARETIAVDPENPGQISTRGDRDASAVMGGILIAFGIVTLIVAILDM